MQESLDQGLGINIEKVVVSDHVRVNLESAARWGRLTALGGFFLSGFIFVMALIWLKMALSAYHVRSLYMTSAVIALFLAIVLFFPGFYVQRFCTNIQRSLKNDDQSDFEVGVDYLKMLFRTLGLYSLVLIAVLLLFGGWYIYLQLLEI